MKIMYINNINPHPANVENMVCS